MIDFLKYKKFYFVLSSSLLIFSLVSLLLWGLRPSIDFTGGTLLGVKFERGNCRMDAIRGALGEKDPGLVLVQSSNDGCLLRFKPIDEAAKDRVLASLREKFGEVKVLRFETVGPTLGSELLVKTLTAVILATLAILGYVAWQFKDRMYGVCAILAMFHDTFILLGSFAVLGHFLGMEIDTLFVTAVLTTLSFSVHDTVVVFNSIREAVAGGKSSSVSDQRFDLLVNRAINATIVRSFNNSFTIIFMLLCLVLLGGETIHAFALALLIGTILGTYSSTFVASPLLTVWRQFVSKRG